MIKGEINFKELVSTGTTFQVEPQNDIIESDDEISKEEFDKELLNHLKPQECLGGLEDEDCYDATEPFEILSAKMEELPGCNRIRKRVLRKGYGEKPTEKSIVKVHYNAYTEYNEDPFDCTYAQKRPKQFVIDSGEVIPGFDFAVQSMQINEKSQFLIKPELAYGSLGCLDRIPANSTVLFEVELIEIIDCGAAEKYENLTEEQKNEFANVYKFCMAQCAKGKDFFLRNNLKRCIKEYNIAAAKLENAQLDNYEDQLKQQDLLFKLYSNLLVCHTKAQEPKKACINFNKINDMVKGTDLKITAKAYYNNAKCLRMLGDYTLAKNRLQKAYNLEPRNPEILNEFRIIDEEQKKYKEQQMKIATAMVGEKTEGMKK